MKYLYLAIVLLFSGCAGMNLSPKSLKYETASNFKIGISTEHDVAQKLGASTSKSEKDSFYTLNYDDPKTGFQRLSLNFNKATKTLLSVLWIPTEGEPESSLNGAKEQFKNSKFERVETSNSDSHSISDIIVFVDSKNGISIRYNPTAQFVEAIARYDADLRAPSATKNK